MADMTYQKLISETLAKYIEGEYLDAYNFLTENSPKVEGNEAQVYNFRYCLACKAGLNDLAIAIMREAIIDKGYWYSYDYLFKEEDIKPLTEYNEFHELAEICKIREEVAVRDSKPYVKIIKPGDYTESEKHPLLIALHGNGQNVRAAEENWKSCLESKYVLAALQSSQMAFAGAYHWNDVIKASSELKEQFERITQDSGFDMNEIIVGGFSAGARTSLCAILNDMIRVKGYILVGPWLPEIDEWEPLVDKLKVQGVKGYIICGDKDEDCIKGTEKFVAMLENRSIPYVYKVIKGLSHAFPEDFDIYLKEAIRYISDK